MPNDAGRYSKEEVIASGLPYYIPKSKRWTHTPYPFAILISKSRCERFGMPILGSGREKPSAFLYSASAGTGPMTKSIDTFHYTTGQAPYRGTSRSGSIPTRS